LVKILLTKFPAPLKRYNDPNNSLANGWRSTIPFLILYRFVPFCFRVPGIQDRRSREILVLCSYQFEQSTSPRPAVVGFQATSRFQRAGLRFMNAASLSRAKALNTVLEYSSYQKLQEKNRAGGKTVLN